MRPDKENNNDDWKIKWKDNSTEKKKNILKKDYEPNYSILKASSSLFDNCVFTISLNIIALMGCQGKD